ncbi:hypothetical protein [Roseateles chitinivorans]|uniref:hypothetical protein n=1 Tax=Roseateles chitinivorans TaxID=2917965 RepID=UPI003D671653
MTDRSKTWLFLLAATPWLMLLVACLLWALTSERAVKYAGSFLAAQPIAVATALVLAAAAVAVLNILVGMLSLLWKPSKAGGVILGSGLMVTIGACVQVFRSLG